LTPWKKHGRLEIRKTKFPNIWETRTEGRYFARCHVTNPRTGKLVEIHKLLDSESAAAASKWLEAERERIGSGQTPEADKAIRFSEFCARFVERAVAQGRLKSAKSRERWRDALKIHILPQLGDLFIDKLRPSDIEGFKDALLAKTWQPGARRKPRPKDKRPVAAPRRYSPVSINGHLAILRTLTAAAARELGIVDPCAAVQDLDTSTHRTYSREAPNRLAPEDVPRFLAVFAQLYPQHLAMAVLGIMTGLRPSSMRPLRRRGPSPDVLWSEGILLVRQSHTRRTEVMQKTKTGADQEIALPPALLAVLERHVAEHCIPGTPKGDSDLLFPSATGGLMSASALDDPFRAVGKALGLSYKITPRSMRRSFKDLSRRAGLAKLVEGSISGHVTEAMDKRYSTIDLSEQRAGLARVEALALPAHLGAHLGAESETATPGEGGRSRSRRETSWAILDLNQWLPPCEVAGAGGSGSASPTGTRDPSSPAVTGAPVATWVRTWVQSDQDPTVERIASTLAAALDGVRSNFDTATLRAQLLDALDLLAPRAARRTA